MRCPHIDLPRFGPPSRVARTSWLLALCLLMHAPGAFGQGEVTEDPGTRLVARELAQQGADLLDEGRYQEAFVKLRRARELVPAPTIRVLEAEALARLGRLVEAAEGYEAVLRTRLSADSPDAFREAVDQATQDLARLEPRIPRLIVVVRGASAESVKVEVDGHALPPAMLGLPRPVDPGSHEIAVQGPDDYYETKRVTLDEGEQKRAVFQVGLVAREVELDEDWEEPTAEVKPEADRAEPGEAQRTIGWGALGVGAAGMAVGVISGLLMLEKKSELDEACGSDGNCPSPFRSDYDAFRTARTVSWVGYGVGFAGLGIGVILLLTAPDRPEGRTEAHVTPWLGLAQIGVSGRF